MSERNFETLLTELLTQVRRIHERLDIIDEVPLRQQSQSLVNYKNDVRVGSGSNRSKHDMIKLLRSYVSSEYDLVSLRTRNDITWERLKAFDLNTLGDTDASITKNGVNVNGIPIYKVVTSQWYIELTPTISGVNVLFNKFRKMDEDNIDDLRAIAQVVRTMTKIINA